MLFVAILIGVACIASLTSLRPLPGVPAMNEAPMSWPPAAPAGSGRIEAIEPGRLTPLPNASGPTSTPESARPANATRRVPGRSVPGLQPAPPRPEELSLPELAVFAVLEGELTAEPKDPDWSRPTEARLLERVAATETAAGLHDIHVECRTSLCRLQLSFADRTQGDGIRSISMVALMHGTRLRADIVEQLELEVVVFDSGFNAYGVPMSVLYLRRLNCEQCDR